MKTKIFTIWIILAGLALVCAGCKPRNPALNSVIAAHGNTDWHIDTAEEFLTGNNMGGTSMASNHVPDTWTTQHIHDGLSNTENYFYDSTKVGTGQDTSYPNGIDRTMLFFYAGHGNPDAWSALGNSASQGNMLLGNNAGGGLLRYLWQCSCEVYAHGAITCSDNPEDYGCPGTFDGSADSYSMRNVYDRWGPALTADLRMACGSSTEAWCWNGEVDSIWNHYNNDHYYVSDAFVYGLKTYHANVTPLCITLGGSDWTKTALWDLTFTNLPNDAGTSRYHIQYNNTFTSTPRPINKYVIAKILPVLKLKAMQLPSSLATIQFKQDGDWLVSPEEVRGRGAAVRVNSLSGAVYIIGDTGGFADGRALSEREYLALAMSYLQKQGWEEKYMADPMGSSMRLQSVPVKSEGRDIQDVQKNVIISFKRQVMVADQMVNVLGEGGVMVVQLNNNGSMLNASKIWRMISEEGEQLKVKPYEQALEEALGQIKEPQKYKLDNWNWGYKEEPGNVKQDEMRIVYQFEFVPVNRELLFNYPPMAVEIAGQE
jgi:hypothetical protein